VLGGECLAIVDDEEMTLQHGVSVDTETTSGEEAWRQRGLTLEFEGARLPWPP
jgi:hypothetical protein